MSEITPMVEEVMSYKCKWCSQLHNNEVNAARCAFDHAKYLANTMLDQGYTLESIEYTCGFHWNLTEEQKKITKDNCFIISHWQCCEKPAYRIIEIERGGYLRLWGVGSWSGGYGSVISLNKLPEPHPKEEFYKYK
jgi:hypothetical protein